MNLNKILPFYLIIFCLVSCKLKQQTSQKSVAQLNFIFPKGEKVTNNNFTGTVFLKMLITHDSLNPTAIGNVTFEPNARTKWHYHPAGQILLVTDGIGYYQEKGQLKRIVKKGDVIKCLPNIIHWHGASTESHFVQIAVTNNEKGNVKWLEAVSDEEYFK